MERECDEPVGVMLGIAVCTPVVLHILLFRGAKQLLGRWGMVRSNYTGRVIPTAGGAFLVLSYLLTLLLLLAAAQMASLGQAVFPQREFFLLISGMGTMGLLGWLDDRSADQMVKGFRGHLAVLWREGRMTSGLWKAWGGGATSLLTALPLSPDLARLIVNTGLLALTVNLLNLFDLRPTRAIKVFWLLLFLVMPAAWQLLAIQLWTLPAVMLTLLFFVPEGRQQIMLGDTGANSLGFLAGFLLVLTQSMTAKLILLCLLILLHVLAEFVSFTRVIQSVGWLRRLDQWGREPLP